MISFIHYGNDAMASYRYRCKMPSEWLSADINNHDADVLIYSKPLPPDVDTAKKAKAEGKTVIVDICDPHIDQPHYRDLIKLADLVTAATEWTASYLYDDFEINSYVIPEPFEFEERLPHCGGKNLLWFGHSKNYSSLERVKHQLVGYDLTVVSNIMGAIPWSIENLDNALKNADIVVIPETEPYKSPNRAVEAIRAGCFVVAEPHPSLEGFPVYTGNLRKGIEWAYQNPEEANAMTLKAQTFVKSRFSPRILEHAWRTAIQLAQSYSNSAPGVITGTDG